MSARAAMYAEAFLARWHTHYVPTAVATRKPEDVDLPEDWEDSLRKFFSAGLPLEAMYDAVQITMDREDVAHDSLFRYFCGVCRRMLRDRHGEQRHPHTRPPADSDLPRLPRSTVRQVACPLCGATAGEPCVGARGKPRESNHSERVLAAAEAQ